jgi:parallel beta-helix repeat protein
MILNFKVWARSTRNILRVSNRFATACFSTGRELKTWHGILSLLMVCHAALAATYVNRDNQGNIHDVTLDAVSWGVAGSPYILEGQVTVAEGATLTVGAGVTVQVSSGMGIYVNGNLNANGAVFTINGDGYWHGIYLSGNSSGSVINSCTVNRAGADNIGYYHGAYRQAAIYIDASLPTITGCTISDSAGFGIELYPNGGIIQNNAFNNIAAGWQAVAYDALGDFPTITGNTLSGTGIAGIRVPSGNLEGTKQWNNPGAGLAYYLNGEFTITASSRLTIDPGVTVKNSGNRLLVYGTLNVQGTATQPVVVTSANDAPAPGDWLGIYFGDSAGGSTLSYTTVAYAGHSSMIYVHNEYRSSAVYLDTCNPTFDHCTISQSASNGVEMYASTASISNGVIQACGGHGLKAEGGSRPTISNTRFSGNGTTEPGYYTILTDASSVPAPAKVTFAGNRLSGVQIKGGTLGADAQWKNWADNAPYVVTGDTTLSEGAKLVIEPGTTVKASGAGLYFYGVVTANGSPSAITFTSINDDTAGGDSNGDGANSLPVAGNWKGVYLGAGASQSLFNHCVFRYGGADNIGYYHGQYKQTILYVDGSAITLTNSVIASSAGHGVEFWSSPSDIRGNFFQDMANGWYAMRYGNISDGVFPALSGNAAAGGGYPGISVPAGTLSNTNTWNKPGVDFPYYLEDEITLAESGKWILDPGVVFKSANLRILVLGNLQALGTATDPVVFTSRNAAPAPGDWKGLYFGAAAGGSILKYVTLSYAGRDSLNYVHGAYRYAAMYLDACSPQVDSLTVTESLNNGVELWSSQSSFSNLSVQHCGGYAFKSESQSRPAINNAAFNGNGWQGNGCYTIGMDASCVPVPSNTAFTTNRMPGIEIWGGTLGANGTWKVWATNAPYVITKDSAVDPGVALVIAPGSTVKFQYSRLIVNGTITANGTSGGTAGKIAFTSWQDDTSAGDSNGDSGATAASAGDWMGFYLSPTSGTPVFNNCVFRYAGRDNLGYFHGAYHYATIYIDQCAPAFYNCVISDSWRHGLEFYGSTASVQNCQFSNFAGGGYAIVQNTLDCHLALTGNSVSGTGIPGVALPAGTIASNVTLSKPGDGFYYYCDGKLDLAEGVTLTVNSGVSLKTLGGGIYVYGTLVTLGTASAPVVFTSSGVTPAPGDWKGIYFGEKAGNSILNYTTVSYAGQDNLNFIHNAYRYTAVYVDACSPWFNHLTIANSLWDGVECWASQAAYNDLTINNCGRHAFQAQSLSRPVIARAAFANNGLAGGGYYTIGMDASCVPSPSSTVFTANRKSGIQIWGGTLSANGEWKNWAANAPYVVTAEVTVADAVTLAIEAGTTVKFQGSRLVVNGVLEAVGNPSSIAFTSYRDDTLGGNSDDDSTAPAPGDWKGVYLSPNSGASVVGNCAFRYAGADNLGFINGAYRMTALYLDNCSPVITNSSFAGSLGHGVELFSSNARLAANAFSDMGGNSYPVAFDTLGCFPAMSDNATTGQGYNGVAVPGGGMGVSGTWSRPGTNFPYYLNGDVSVGADTTLYIDPGVTVLSGGPGLYVNGNICASGSASLPIRFDSRKSSVSPGDWKGIYLGAGASSSWLRFCVLANAGADNLGYYSSAYRRTALYVDGSAPELACLSVVGSAVNGVMIAGSSAALRNSLISSNGGDGLVLFNDGTPQCVNNTVAYNQGSAVHVYSGAPVIANNILAFNRVAGVSVEGGSPALRNNCVSGNQVANYDRVAAGLGDLSSNPNFVAPGSGNFKLQSGSPAINAGAGAYVQTDWVDLAGNLRLSDGAVDIGAYEYGAVAALHIVDTLIRNAGESVYAGENIHSVDDQTKTQTVAAGGVATFQFQVKYSGNATDDLRVTGTAGGKGWTVKYFNTLSGATDITTLVTQPGGWVVTGLNPGAAFEFRAEITPDSLAASGSYHDSLISVNSIADPARSDTVRARIFTPEAELPGQQVYAGTFQNPVGSEWSFGHIDVTPTGSRPFLGQFGNTNTVLTLASLAAHSEITVVYDLYIIGPWDGNGSPGGVGLFTTSAGGNSNLLHTTFNNAPENGAANGQSYPQTYPAAYAARTGAAETNSLGYSSDTVYHLSHTFAHTASTVEIQFGAVNLGPGETWGLANLAVYITPSDAAPATLKAMGWKSDGFHLLITGAAQQTYQLQATTNWVNWTELGSFRLESNSVEAIDSGTPRSAKRFYRAAQVP